MDPETLDDGENVLDDGGEMLDLKATFLTDDEHKSVLADDLLDEAEGDPHTTAPIDRGWAWVILAGKTMFLYGQHCSDTDISQEHPLRVACFFEVLVFGGLMRSFGVLFLQYQQRFHSSASETALMSTIQNLVISFTALFVMTIGLEKISSRTSVAIGGFATFLSYIITAFTTDIKVFYFVQGILGGFGMAMVHPPMYALLGVYFNKHRGLANSIFTCGGSLGGLFFAPIIIKLFEEYNFTGTMIIISGILLNVFVSAALMRPIEFYTKPRLQPSEQTGGVEIELNENYIQNGGQGISEIQKETGTARNGLENKFAATPLNKNIGNFKQIEFQRQQSHDPAASLHNDQSSPLLQRIRAFSVGNKRLKTTSENENGGSHTTLNGSRSKLRDFVSVISSSQKALYAIGDGLCGSFVDLSNMPHKKRFTKNINNEDVHINEMAEMKTQASRLSCGSSIQSCIGSTLATVFDITLLRNPVFLAFLIMAFCIMSGVALTPVYIAPYAKDIGITNEQIGMMISIMASIDIVAKIGLSVVADRQWIKRTTLLAIAAFVLGTACHLIRFIKTFAAMMAFVVVSGIFVGQYMSMFAVILMELIGAEKFKKSLGFVTLVHGISIAIFFPIAGLLRDNTGSYIYSYHLMGGLSYLAGGLVLIVSFVHRRTTKRDKDAEQEGQVT